MAGRSAPPLGDFFKKAGRKKRKGAAQDAAGPSAEEERAAAKAAAAAATEGEAEEGGREEEAGEAAGEEARGLEEDEAEAEVEDEAAGLEGQEEEPPAPGPRMDFAASSRDAVEIHGLEPGAGEVARLATFPAVQGADALCWSPDGRWLGLLGPRTLQVVDASDGAYDICCELSPLGGEARPGLKSFHFSPLGTFVACFEPYSRSDGQGEPEANLAVWRLGPDPTLVGAFVHERRAECAWPALKWTLDERRCCRLARDEVQVFPGERPEAESQEAVIPCEGVTALEPAPRPEGADSEEGGARSPDYVALFVPQRKGERARCLVYSLEDPSAATAIHDLPQADNVSMRWNSAGTSLLLLTSTEVDGTGKSYYGKTGLHLLQADGSVKGLSVVGAKAGPVHDVAWSPRKDEFLMLHGDLPCAMTLHDGVQAKKLLDFGKAHRNSIQWSPMGRFFTLGGFGQLAGDLDFWDRPSGEKLGQTRYECCVDCQWSADGRHLLGWTTAPRMRVENRLELFDYTGCRLYRVDYEELYAAAWRPVPADVYPDRPPTPSRSRMGSVLSEKEPSKSAAYRAPMSSGTLAARLRAEGEGGERTRAKTAMEQAAEAELRAKRQDPGKKEIREVPLPADLVGGLIGAKGSAIKELISTVKLPLEVKPPSSFSNDGSESACVRIGPAGPWDDLDRAEDIIRKRIEELKVAKKNRLGREVPVPEDLVARLIGLQGATIQELSRQAGVPLKVRQASDGSGNQVVVISHPRGEEDASAVQRVEDLVTAKIAELRESEREQQQRRERDGRGEPSEMTVPVELVGGLIGYKGSTIEELAREAGVPLRIPRRRNGDETGLGKVLIGPADPEAVARATELVQAKLEELQSGGKGRGDKSGDRWANQKGWKSQKGWEGEAGWDGEQGWAEEKGWAEGQAWAEDGWKEKKKDWAEDRGWAGDRGWREDGGGWREESGWAEDSNWAEDGAWAEEPRNGERAWRGERNRGGERTEDGREGSRAGRGQKWRGEQGAAWTNGRVEEEQEQSRGALQSYSSGSSRPSERRRAFPDGPAAEGAGAGEAEGERAAQAEKKEKSKTTEELDRLRSQGDAALLSGDFRAAVDFFTKAVRLVPRDCRSLCGRARAHLQLGEAHEAHMSACIAVRVQPESVLGNLRKGLALRALGQEDKALLSLQEAHRLDPDNREAREALGLSSPSGSRRPGPATDEPKVATAQKEEERAFHCAECGDAAEFGAIDEADGQWYCKACWESFVDEDPSAQAPVVPEEDVRQAPAPATPVAAEALAHDPPAAGEEQAPDAAAAPAAVTPARRRWADEPVQDDGLEDFAQPRDRRRGPERAPAASLPGPALRGQRPERPPAPERERHQGGERAAGQGGSKDHRDRRQGGGKGAAKGGAGGRDQRDRRQGAERSGGRGVANGSRGGGHGGPGGRQGGAAAAAPAQRPEPPSVPSATMSMPRNPFGAAKPS